MRTLLVVAVLLVSMVAAAQPGAPYPPPQSYPPPAPYGYAPRPMQVQLTLDEQYLLESGYISDGQQVGGTLIAAFFGFGIGHAVQGRFMERGYAFALGDAITGTIAMTGMVKAMMCFDRCSDAQAQNAMNWLIVGTLSFAVVRTWETIDAAVGPSEHNRKLRALHARLGMQPMYTQLRPFVSVPHDNAGAVGGVSLRF